MRRDTKMRSVYYRSKINILDRMREEGEEVDGLGYATIGKDISKVVFPKTDVRTLKRDSIAYADSKSFAVKLIAIPPVKFLSFLTNLGATNNWWMLRFWDLRGETERTISAGREHPRFNRAMTAMLRRNKRLHEWGGVEVTPPNGIRVGLYRYPTASISVRIGSDKDERYLKIEQRWETFLKQL